MSEKKYYVFVSYDENGGGTQACPASNKIRTGGVVPILPIPPEKEGFKFIGWNTDKNGLSVYFTDNMPVYDDITVYAQWLKLTERKDNFFNVNPGWQVKGTKSRMGDDWIYIAEHFSDIPETLIRPYLDTFKSGHPPFAAVCPNIKGGFYKKRNPLMICMDEASIYFISAVSSARHELPEVDFVEQSGVLLRAEINFYLNNGVHYSVACNRCNQNIIDFMMGKIRSEAAGMGHQNANYFSELEERSYSLMTQGNLVLKNAGDLISYLYKAPKSKRDSDFLILLTEAEIIFLINEKSGKPVSKKTVRYIPLRNVKSAEIHNKLLVIKTWNGREITAKVASIDIRAVDAFISACKHKLFGDRGSEAVSR